MCSWNSSLPTLFMCRYLFTTIACPTTPALYDAPNVPLPSTSADALNKSCKSNLSTSSLRNSSRFAWSTLRACAWAPAATEALVTWVASSRCTARTAGADVRMTFPLVKESRASWRLAACLRRWRRRRHRMVAMRMMTRTRRMMMISSVRFVSLASAAGRKKNGGGG
ncbi:unnamed protein product [Linum trigynum]|uniref:Secreted protein n=1 Tax=Linum trigynum TaxID=586398 RepID=A0AAV2EL81_9ROSI